MGLFQESQRQKGLGYMGKIAVPAELILPNPKLKLLDQVREVLRIRHYAIRTEQCYCDWIRRYIHFHKMLSKEELTRDAVYRSSLAIYRSCLQRRVSPHVTYRPISRKRS